VGAEVGGEVEGEVEGEVGGEVEGEVEGEVGGEVGVEVEAGFGFAADGSAHAVRTTATARPTPGRVRCMGHGPSGQQGASTGEAARMVGEAAAIDGSRRRANYWHSPRIVR
jgi:hypothetical protein